MHTFLHLSIFTLTLCLWLSFPRGPVNAVIFVCPALSPVFYILWTSLNVSISRTEGGQAGQGGEGENGEEGRKRVREGGKKEGERKEEKKEGGRQD